MSKKQNNIHPARSFVRGFAVGCLVLSGVFALVNDRARDLWPTVNVREVALDEETLLVNRAFDVLRNEFYRDIEDEDVYTFIDGALKSLDANSGFVEPGVLSVMQGRSDEDQTSPEPSFVLGIFWAATSSDFTIQAVVPDSPADRVGLRPGDVLLSVDGEGCFASFGARSLHEDVSDYGYEQRGRNDFRGSAWSGTISKYSDGRTACAEFCL